jgi:hypothetical protein
MELPMQSGEMTDGVESEAKFAIGGAGCPACTQSISLIRGLSIAIRQSFTQAKP